MSKHSDSPWTLEERNPGGVTWDAVIRNKDRDPVALVMLAGYTKAEGQANANVLVMAPTTLKALKVAHSLLDMTPEQLPDNMGKLIKEMGWVIDRAEGLDL